MLKRVLKKEVLIGNVKVGGREPIAIQSMTNTDTKDIKATVKQILRLKEAGCEIIRIAVPDMESSKAIYYIKSQIDLPLVADIHFDYKLAIESIKNGADKIRINPGNIGSEDRIKKIIDIAKEKKVSIRIGVNSGSLEKDLLEKYKRVTPEAIVESAQKYIQIFEKYNFYNLVISLKASNVSDMIQANRYAAQVIEYPLHLGVTEAGTIESGAIKSSVGIGTLLMEGIGDTIRVSLTGDPINEIRVAKKILKACGYLNEGVEIISCPTCGRCNIDLINIANIVEEKLIYYKKNIKVAIMGCAVNGPGEAKEADIGIAGGKGDGLIFKKGEIIEKVPEGKIIDRLMELIIEI
jgi:(E)-4-hydroxy-3-methylbut-2-enyl-diphosphate synthase